MAKSIVVGYARVSSKEQNEARQIEKLIEAGVDERNIYLDKESGRDFNREQYQAMLSRLRDGDVVFVSSLDRFGRNYTEIARQWDEIVNVKKADIVILDMPLLDTRNKSEDLTNTLISDIVLKLLSYVADIERRSIKERQAQGIAIAKKNGVYTGRKPIALDKEKFEKVYGEVERGERTNKWAMEKLGLKRNTYYKAINEYKTRTGRWSV